MICNGRAEWCNTVMQALPPEILESNIAICAIHPGKKSVRLQVEELDELTRTCDHVFVYSVFRIEHVPSNVTIVRGPEASVAQAIQKWFKPR